MSTDEEQRRASIVRIASAIAACGFIAVTLARVTAGDSGFAPLLGFGAAVSLASFWLNRRGHALVAGVLLMIVLVFTAVFLMIFSEGIHDAALLTVPGILVLAALTVPRRLYIVMAGVFVLLPAVVGTLELTRTIVTPFSDHTDVLAIFDLTIILVMTAAAVELMTATITGSASRARSSEARFRKLFNNSSESIFVFGALSATGAPEKIIEVNDIACSQLGYTHAEMVRLPPAQIFEPESIAKIQEAFSSLRAEASAVCECLYRTKEGARLPVELSIQRFDIGGEPAIITNARDITERKRADDLIRSALREKEVLLREIHHRVKNNMQVISSLLNLQASQTQDAVTRTMLE
ncbi:MAG TPA: PAS domain S-box protein, partial [Bacteroidota bacterium]|nr:PAS domain S-box protein [Bacteroidota bacterium]